MGVRFSWPRKGFAICVAPDLWLGLEFMKLLILHGCIAYLSISVVSFRSALGAY